MGKEADVVEVVEVVVDVVEKVVEIGAEVTGTVVDRVKNEHPVRKNSDVKTIHMRFMISILISNHELTVSGRSMKEFKSF